MEVTCAEPLRAMALTDGVLKRQEVVIIDIKSKKYSLRRLQRDRRNVRLTVLFFCFPWYFCTYWKLRVYLIELFLPSIPCRVRGLITSNWNITVFILLLPNATLNMQGCPGHAPHRSPYSTESKDGINGSRPHGHGYL